MIAKRTLYKALLFICLLKTFYFLTFIFDRNPGIPSEFILNTFTLMSGDTKTYYYPLQTLYEDGQYNGMCRMPGLAPVYLPLRVFLSHNATLTAIIFIQFIGDILATLLCSILCFKIFKSLHAFWGCILLSSLSAFVLVRANYLLSDSLCCTTLVLSGWFLYQWKETNKSRHLLISGAFMVWAVFLRQICVVMFPSFLGLILFYSNYSWRKIFKSSVLFILPFILGISLWTIRNKTTYNRTILFVAPITECMGQLTPEYFAIKKLLISMGQDVEYWTVGTAAHWFYNENANCPCPITEKNFSPSLTQDSIMTLHDNYRRFTESDVKDSALSQQIISSCAHYSAIYKQENALRYYLLDPFQHFVRFLFPKRLDDFPLPKRSEGKWYLQLVKGGNFLLMLAIHAALFIALFGFLFKRMGEALIWLSIGLLPVAVLSSLGWVEQRYLASSHYFFILAVSGVSAMILNRLRHALPKQ
jgi:hypothetical protein